MSTNNPPPSAIQSLLSTHPLPPKSSHSPHHHNLALQIAHNLKYQHLWTSLRLHTSPALPRPVISGLPPSRLYVHPDEQIALLQKQKEAGKTGMPELEPQREWVLPSHLREKWSLRRFGEVFDVIDAVPASKDGEELFPASGEDAEAKTSEEAMEVSTWRTDMPKRALLATLDDDSTVVYYIVHDGIVKPRQN